MKFEKMNNTEVAVNKVSLFDEDGQEMSFTVSDTVMEAILQMCQTGKVQRPTSTGESNTKLKVEIEAIKVNNKTFYQIRNRMWYGKSGNPTVSYQLGNAKIKALDGVKTIELARADGKGSFKAWGYWKKTDAEKALAKLPEYITAEEIAEKRASFQK